MEADDEVVASSNRGCIAFYDNTFVIFYSKDLATTLSELISGPDSKDAINCVHGLAVLNQ